MKNPQLYVIVPCYNEEESLPCFLPAIRKVAAKCAERYGLAVKEIFVDDGSSDGTLEFLRAASRDDPHVHYVSFSRNFGKESAIYAGLRRAAEEDADYAVIMDADLQDPPELLPQMYEALASGEYDSAATRRTDRRGEPPVRSFFARCFYKLINRFSDAEIVDGARDYRMLNRKMLDAVLSMSEYNRFTKGIFGWVGFRTLWIPYKNVPRVAGQTKWSFWKLFAYALQGIMAFSTAPLYVASLLGLLFCLIAFFMTAFIVVRTLLWGDPVGGWPSLACIITFLGGVQLFCIGTLGQYLAKTYMETKGRPIYIEAERDGEWSGKVKSGKGESDHAK